MNKRPVEIQVTQRGFIDLFNIFSISHRLKNPKSNPVQANDKIKTKSNHIGIEEFNLI